MYFSSAHLPGDSVLLLSLSDPLTYRSVRNLRFSADGVDKSGASLLSTAGSYGDLPFLTGLRHMVLLLPDHIRSQPPDPGSIAADVRLTSHRLFTSPRFSPGCPHCVDLWLGRSIIVPHEYPRKRAMPSGPFHISVVRSPFWISAPECLSLHSCGR